MTSRDQVSPPVQCCSDREPCWFHFARGHGYGWWSSSPEIRALDASYFQLRTARAAEAAEAARPSHALAG